VNLSEVVQFGLETHNVALREELTFFVGVVRLREKMVVRVLGEHLETSERSVIEKGFARRRSFE